ncbi:MAG: TolC family protein [Acidobacteria bacterium]|nr:TolC family protein [Acidobacteriota bacterium]
MTARRLLVIAAGLVLALVAPAPPANAQEPLTPQDVLRAVDRALPLIEQARRDVDAAAADLVSARGGFDLNLKASGSRLDGEYDNTRLSTLFEQPLTTWGATAYGGYRAGSGTFADYDGKAETTGSGEVLAGLEVPLLRGRAIDERRAGTATAEIGVERAARQLDAARLGHFTAALASYWDWVAAGRQLSVARALLTLAEVRDTQLADAVALGQIAAIERTDNQRAIFQRRSALASAQRLFEQAAIDLSLYYRGADGAPLRPSLDRLPPLPATSAGAEPDEAEEVAGALARRPDVQARRLARDRQRVDVRLAENTQLPTLDFFSEVGRERRESTKGGTSFEVGLTFKLPVQRRKAIGQTLKAQAALARADLDLRWAEDQVRAEVQDALSAVRAAATVREAVADEVAVARELERLERDKFDLGDSTQFLVNLRELAAADAAVRDVRAHTDYEKALARLDRATGRVLDRLPPP